MTLKEMRELVRMNLGNVDREIVSDQEIDFLLNRAQKIINKKGLIKRQSAYASSAVDKERYRLPHFLVSLLRVDYDGDKINLVNYDDILELDVS